MHTNIDSTVDFAFTAVLALRKIEELTTALDAMPAQKRMCREAWRDYGAGLLAQRVLMPSNNEFGAWIKANGLDTGPASSHVTRSNAMWLAENWAVVVETTTDNHNPTNLRQECRKLGHAWAFDQREPKAAGQPVAAKRGAKPHKQPAHTGWIEAVKHHLGDLPVGYNRAAISDKKWKRAEVESEFGQPIPKFVDIDSQQARDIAAAVQRCYDKQNPVAAAERVAQSQAEAEASLVEDRAQIPENDKARFDRLLQKSITTAQEQFHIQLEAEKEKARADIYATLEPERERMNRACDEMEAERDALREARKTTDQIMTQNEYRLIRSCLHTDTLARTEEQLKVQHAKFTEAFIIFSRVGKNLNPHLPAAELKKRGWVNPFKRGG